MLILTLYKCVYVCTNVGECVSVFFQDMIQKCGRESSVVYLLSKCLDREEFFCDK